MIPRIRIAHLPTPVEPMLRLARLLHGPRLWVKRDDQTGLATGGNKTRKLEFVLAEAQATGARTLITTGAAQSNHCRQTAALAARMDLQCILVLSGESGEQPDGNLLIDRLLGAKIVWSSRAEREAKLIETFNSSWAAGERPYLIPLGASTATGALGYAYAFDELMKQEVRPDWIIVASSSAGTQAGLVLGARRAGWSGKILGISIDHYATELQARVAALATEASERFGEKIHFAAAEILVNDGYLGAGYSMMGTPEIEAIRLFAANEGLLLDPVYTARAAAGMIDLIRRDFFKEEETILFWHTGGIPALFARRYAGLLA
ncbi:MAG TPA: D-cysteine desulfhydrase family protein [Levilinea sp.]|nr:D-cysteine desulfhydrase family protein [Levilinea sp.]